MNNPTTVTGTAVKRITNMDNHINYGYTPSKGCLYGQSNNTGQGSVPSSPIFNVTYNNASQNQFSWGASQNETYEYPDQVTGPPMVKDSGFSTSESIVVDSIYKWREKIAASLSGSFHGVMDDISGSGSASVSGMYGTSIFDHMHSEYFMDFYVQELLTFSVNMDELKTSVTAGFSADLKNLQTDLSIPANRQAYIHFLAKYGTHILTSGTYGGTYRMQSAVQKTLVQTTQNIQIKTKMHAAFSMGLEGGKMSASAAYSSSTFMSDYKDQISIQTYVQGAEDGSATQTKTAWVQGLYGTPYLVYATPGIPTGAGQSTPSQFSRISMLVPADLANADLIEANLNEMIKVYMRMPLFGQGKIISEPVSIPSGQNANANGYCMLSGRIEHAGNAATVIASISSSGDALGNQVITNSLNFSTDNVAVALGATGITFPAANGASYGYKPTDAFPDTFTSNADVYALMNLPPSECPALTSSLIDPQDQEAFTPSQDGFIIATVDRNNQNGVCGQVFLQRKDGTMYAAASNNFWIGKIDIPTSSLIFPVRAGETYSIIQKNIAGTASYSATFMPLDSRLTIGQPTALNSADLGTTTTAPTDGFLAALINASGGEGNGCMAQMNLKSGAQPDQMVTRSSCTAQYQNSENTNVQWASALLPIPKGWSYEAEVLNNVSDLANTVALWIPLTAANS